MSWTNRSIGGGPCEIAEMGLTVPEPPVKGHGAPATVLERDMGVGVTWCDWGWAVLVLFMGCNWFCCDEGYMCQ